METREPLSPIHEMSERDIIVIENDPEIGWRMSIIGTHPLIIDILMIEKIVTPQTIIEKIGGKTMGTGEAITTTATRTGRDSMEGTMATITKMANSPLKGELDIKVERIGDGSVYPIDRSSDMRVTHGRGKRPCQNPRLQRSSTLRPLIQTRTFVLSC
jgi:hypothetical protein